MTPDRPRSLPGAGPLATEPAAELAAEPAEEPAEEGSDPGLRPRLEQAWALLAGQADAIADSITLTLLQRDADVYERLAPELRAEVRMSTREHIRRGLRVLAGDRTTLEQAHEIWRETGRRRARQGVPLELVINAYIIGARTLWEALVARARQGDGEIDPDMLVRAARAVWANLDVQNRVLVEAYHRESARLQRQDLRRQQAVIEGLLEGRGGDPDFARESRDALGLGAEDRVACVAMLDDSSPLDSLGPAEDRLDRWGARAFWHLRGGVFLGLLAGPLPAEAALAEAFEPAAGRVGLGLCADGVAGFAAAFQLAVRAAETLPRHEPGVACVSGRLPEVLLAGSPQLKPLLLSQTLGPLLAQPDPQRRTLLETLAALLRHDGSPTHAAQDLYCHRNTVIYRLRQIEDLTGRSLADPRDKLLLSLAMLARRADP